MEFSIEFVERKISETTSIESVFRQVAKELSRLGIKSQFRKVPFGHSLVDILKNLLQYKRGDSDIYHITGHIHYMGLVLPADRTVLTIHDLVILRMRQGVRRWVLKKLLFDWPVKRLKYITVISQATKDELIRATNCSGEKIRIIENPLRDDFIVDKTREFDANKPVILQIGTSTVKNVPNLIAALKGVGCRLRLIGPLNDELVELLQLNGIDYDNRIDLTDVELREEYMKADLVSFCSTYEGFGLPIIEAQAVGTPLVTSNISPMKDVAGEGALLADPHDIESIRRAILRLRDDPDIRHSVVVKGRLNIERFSASHIAAQYAKLYQEMFKNK